MSRKPNVDDVLKRSLPSASDQQIETAVARIHSRLLSDRGHAAVPPIAEPPVSASRTRWPLALAATLVIAAVGTAILWRPADTALFRVVEGDVYQGETIRSNGGGGAVVALSDGSRIEMRSQTELSVERADDGVRVRLTSGGIIVNAAKRRTGHLYVQTKDMTVSVVGTVFIVNADDDGSRVTVIEGEVRVQQGQTEKKLLPGEQVTTSPAIVPAPITEEIAWSRNAGDHLALLQRSAVAPPPVLPQQPATSVAAAAETRPAFEVASIRFKPRVAGGRGVPPGAEACPNLNIQLDPRRLSIPGATLNSLIVLAHPEWSGSYADPWGSGANAALAALAACPNVTAGGILSGGPGWVRSDLWDIQATIPEGPVDFKVSTRESLPGARRGNPPPPVTVVEDIGPRVRKMLQNLLADRFQLVLRPQTKEMPVYLLTVGKDGFKSNGNPIFATTATGEVMRINGQVFGSEKRVMRRGISEVEGRNVPFPRDIPPGAVVQRYISLGIWKMSMPEIATSLMGIVERPVLDRTNLAGTFDFHLDYDRDGTSSRPSIFKAIEEVGLKLEPARAPVEVWVIERAEKPTEN